MNVSRWCTLGVTALLAIGATGPVARADLHRDVGRGLGFAGFNIQGYRNFLSGGVDFLVNNSFAGNPLDFGIFDLTLQGPVSFEVSTGRRLLPTLDISLQTALTGAAAAAPLNYTMNYDVGAASGRTSGSVLLDADFSLNGLGFYDLQFTYSSRQEVERKGLLPAGPQAFDLDLGPTSISGNIVADALALVTAPLFEQSGQVNPFEPFSGLFQLNEMLQDTATRARERLALGGDPADDGLARANLAHVWYPQPLAGANGLASAEVAPANGGFRGAGAVPEPATLVLLLFGLAVAGVSVRRVGSVLFPQASQPG